MGGRRIGARGRKRSRNEDIHWAFKDAQLMLAEYQCAPRDAYSILQTEYE